MQAKDFKVIENKKISRYIYKLDLYGDASIIKSSGQFVNVKIEGLFLRRPISICDFTKDTITLIYKVVGEGTKKLSQLKSGSFLNVLLPLGNGFDISYSGQSPLLIGGGVGVPPLYLLAKELINNNIDDLSIILGFNSIKDIFFVDEFKELTDKVYVTTMDGSYGTKGVVSDLLIGINYSYVYSCGPIPMLKALSEVIDTGYQFSFEERMACGFGACMGCTKKTQKSYKRICKEGPVLFKEEIVW